MYSLYEKVYRAEHNVSYVKRLLQERDVNINERDQHIHGRTGLMAAVVTGNCAIVELFVVGGADVDMQDDTGLTAFLLAATMGRKSVVELLLKHGATVPIRALLLASVFGNLEVIELLLDSRLIDINDQDEKGRTALMFACQNDHLRIVEFLLDRNADRSLQDQNGSTALMEASRNGNHTVVQLLLSTNPSRHTMTRTPSGTSTVSMTPSSSSTTRTTPMTTTSSSSSGSSLNRNSRRMVRALPSSYIEEEVNRQDDKGWTALLYASQNGHLKIVRLLLDQHADINHKTHNGETALLLSCRSGHDASFMFQSQKGYIEVAEYLLNRNAENLNSQDENGNTALIEGARKGHTEIVRLLLSQSNIDFHIENNNGEKAISCAIAQGHSETLQLLEEFQRKLDMRNLLFMKETQKTTLGGKVLIKDQDIKRSIASYLMILEEENTIRHCRTSNSSSSLSN